MDLSSARNELTKELGSSSAVYFGNLASWFKKKIVAEVKASRIPHVLNVWLGISKEDFDLESRRLLKCESANSKEAALQSAATDISSRVHEKKVKRKLSSPQSIGQAQLKRILSAVMQRRSSYRLRENRMRFSMGCRVDNPYRIRCTNSAESQSNRVRSDYRLWRRSMHPSVETAEQTAALQMSHSSCPPVYRSPISLWNLLETLQLNRGVLPSHALYTQAIERTIHGIWHPDPPEHADGETDNEKDDGGQSVNKRRPQLAYSLWTTL